MVCLQAAIVNCAHPEGSGLTIQVQDVNSQPALLRDNNRSFAFFEFSTKSSPNSRALSVLRASAAMSEHA